MWPFTHLALGYLAYSIYVRYRLGRSPTGREALLILVGSQLPDLIDKPLVLLGGPFTTGRTIGHSLLFIIPALVLLVILTAVVDRDIRYCVAFGLAWVVQPFADGAQLFLRGSFQVDLIEVSFWIWPLQLPANDIVAALTGVPLLGTAVANKATWTAQHVPSSPGLNLYIRGFELLITTVAGLLWVYQGFPGLEVLRRRMFGKDLA
jgi:hypothetical protein